MSTNHIEATARVAQMHRSAATVIAFTGPPGSGKDSAAAALVSHLGFSSIAFADALRREIGEAWRIDERMLTYRPTKEIPIPALAVGMCNDPAFVRWAFDCEESLHSARSPRWLMQQWATYRRRYAPSHYAVIVSKWIARQVGLGVSRFAVTDLRDPVELQALRDLGVRLQVVRLHRRETVRLAEDTAGHSSQRHHVKADTDLQNDDSLTALTEAVTALADAALGRKMVSFADAATEVALPIDGISTDATRCDKAKDGWCK